jgi:hypothetical protein
MSIGESRRRRRLRESQFHWWRGHLQPRSAVRLRGIPLGRAHGPRRHGIGGDERQLPNHRFVATSTLALLKP